MPDVDTRRRIDAARDVLVGKVPDPKSQVEQITIALIYKFMDDMDAENEEWGGEREFFAGDFERYRWANLVRSGLGGHETLNLDAEAITRMPENPGIPPFFRSIFNNAYLPYRDPETLRLFLREIDGFDYDHSEHLGDAFEYLLSVLGSQGDAGQFRTPRHIIDFIVSIIDPQKDETVLDPACGTAGFLISAWKHVLNANTDGEGGSTLTPDDRERLGRNFTGYDISPDMVRLSRVNMYLHGFTAPDIREYDTLTSDEDWNRYANVILANPPFMSPKGGIRPHKRFSIQSTRSEVLFVDYMAEHLMADGRAGIIVPEGVIFQSQRAHTALRKMLVESSLAAVVSLPAGVFRPYSGVKTSVLVLDKTIARRTGKVAFFKVENDGYDLGAQRRPIDANDLPQVQAELAEYLRRARAGEDLNGYEPESGFLVEKTKLAENGDYNLSAERYREREVRPTRWPMVALGDVCAIFNGMTSRKSDYKNSGTVKVIKVRDFDENSVNFHNDTNGWIDNKILTNRYLAKGDTLIINAAHNAAHVASKIGYLRVEPPFITLPSGEITILRPNDMILATYLSHLVKSPTVRIALKELVKGIHIYPKDIQRIQIPLPPLDVQREIVAEIEGYQRVIDGARAVVESYRSHVPVDPSWPMVQLGEVAEVTAGQSPPGESYNAAGIGIPFYQGKASFGLTFIGHPTRWTTAPQRFADKGDILMSVRAPVGPVNLATQQICIGRGLAAIKPAESRGIARYVFYVLQGMEPEITGDMGAAFAAIAKKDMANIKIPLPPLDVQKAIVAELEAERALVGANRELIERMESRIASAVGRVWGEE